MNYTYRQLLEALQELSSDELDMHVIVYDQTNEVYHPLNYAGRCEGDGIVDAFHTLLIINDPEETVSEPDSQVVHASPDIRSCEIWIEYDDGSEFTTDMFLDVDRSIEEQVYESFNPMTKEYPQIANFKWKELGI